MKLLLAMGPAFLAVEKGEQVEKNSILAQKVRYAIVPDSAL
jgi:hypothetical protein